MWAAVVLGREHPVLASLLVPVAPLAMVAWGFLAALVEVTWLIWLAALLTSRLRDARGLGERPVVVRAVPCERPE